MAFDKSTSLLKRALQALGFYVRRFENLPFGVDLPSDLRRIGFNETGLVLDVGANEGHFTARMKPQFPETEVHCFEPDPRAFRKLKNLTDKLRRTFSHNFALADKDGDVDLFISENSELSSIVSGSGRQKVTVQRVPSKTLATFLDEINASRVELLKIDAEGAEIAILAGCGERLASIKFVLAEFEFHPTSHPHTSFFALHGFLRERGFFIVCLYNEFVQKGGGLIFGSALFKRELSPA